MPTEHEYKYVISLDFAKQYPEDQLKAMCDEHQFIKQGYLAFSKGMTTRVRFLKDSKKQQWFLTFKQKVASRVIEVEKKLDDRDGSELWEVCVGRVKKDRYCFAFQGVTWEVDLFKKGSHLYFALAEIELAEGSPRPKTVPDFLRPYILYEVPLTDDRFSNKRLGDAEYANRMYLELSAKGVPNERHIEPQEVEG